MGGNFNFIINAINDVAIQQIILKLDTLNSLDIYVGEQNLTANFWALAPFQSELIDVTLKKLGCILSLMILT